MFLNRWPICITNTSKHNIKLTLEIVPLSNQMQNPLTPIFCAQPVPFQLSGESFCFWLDNFRFQIQMRSWSNLFDWLLIIHFGI